MKTWKVILTSAKIRQFRPILEFSDSQLPKIQYHRKCYQRFTLKSYLKSIENKQKENEETLQAFLGESNSYDYDDDKPVRKTSSSSSCTSSTSTSIGLLADQCLFCEKPKYAKKQAKN